MRALRPRPRALGIAAAISVVVSIAAGFVVRASPSRAPETNAQAATGTATAADPATAAAAVPASASAAAAAAVSVSVPVPASAPASEPPNARCAPEAPVAVRVVDVPPGADLLKLAQEKPEALGSASVGSPTRGSLFGGVELKSSEEILHAGGYGWGTELVIRSIERAVREVRRCHPGTPRLYVGDISRDKGGWLRPHRSHQSGLDADIGYFYTSPATWYLKVTSQNLDAERTWALVRALIEGGNVEMIFMDISVQRLVKAYLEKLPKDEQPPPDLFESPQKRDAIIRHAWGHATHFHVRFLDPAAQAMGQRLVDVLPRLRILHRLKRQGKLRP